MTRTLFFAACMALISQAPALAQAPNPPVQLTSTFTDGRDDGWLNGKGVDGHFFVNPQLGNSAPALHIYRVIPFTEAWFIDVENTQSDWVQMLRLGKPLHIGLDVQTREISSWPLRLPQQRELYVEIRDYDNPPKGYLWTSVWTKIGNLDQAVSGWAAMSASIIDPFATKMPTGWHGTGAVNLKLKPVLPKGRTFADVLANADAIAFTSARPGYGYNPSYWDVLFDNITIRTVER